jgi:transposase
MKHGARRAVAQPAAEDPGLWLQLVPQMLVEKFPETAIAQAARGVILPGESIVECELGVGLASRRRLGIRDVLVREALRMLESQGLGSGPIDACVDAGGCDSGRGGSAVMSVPFLLTPAQMECIRPHFPRSRGIPRVDDCRVLSGIIIFVLKGDLRWRDAPPGYGPHKTLDNRFVRLSRMGVFDRIFAALAAEGGVPERLMIDSTHLKAHRTAASLLKKGLFPAASAAPRAG